VSNLGYGSFALSDDGTLVYVDGPSDGTSAARRTLAWIDRSGKQQDIPVPPRQYLSPRISPDGAFIAVDAFDDRGDIFIWDIRRATMRRLTMNPNRDGFAVWTPDSRWVVYTAASDVGNLNLWRVPADGSASPERLLMSTNIQIPTAITPDGHDIIFHEVMPLTSADVMRVPLSGPHTPEVIVQTKDPERQAAVSRDGRWLAYEAGSGPRSEVFVRPYATGPQPRFQISTDGGSKPAWGPNELFYLAPDNSLMRAPMPSGTVTWNAENPTKLLGPLPELPGTPEFTRAYDVSSDGQRFVFVKSSGELPASNTAGIVVVQHWDREVAARVPGK
jgi:Tol biopolymer transport system component